MIEMSHRCIDLSRVALSCHFRKHAGCIICTHLYTDYALSKKLPKKGTELSVSNPCMSNP